MVKKTDSFTDGQFNRILSAGENSQKKLGRRRVLPTKEDQEMFLETFAYTLPRVTEIVGADGLRVSRLDEDRELAILRNLKRKREKRWCNICGNNIKAGQNTCYCGSQNFRIEAQKPKYKEVTVPKEFIQKLKLYALSKGLGPDSVIFRMSRSTADDYIKEIAARAGILQMGLKKPHTHNFRHTYINRGVEAGMSDAFLSNQAGHDNKAMIGEYKEIVNIEREKLKIKDVVPRRDENESASDTT